MFTTISLPKILFFFVVICSLLISDSFKSVAKAAAASASLQHEISEFVDSNQAMKMEVVGEETQAWTQSKREFDFVEDALESAHKLPYGNPAKGNCLPNEMKVQIQGIAGAFCSPKCSASMPCPQDSHKGATAKGQCVLQVPSSPTPSQCALICRPVPGTNGGCPKKGECQPIQGLGICTYPAEASETTTIDDMVVEMEE